MICVTSLQSLVAYMFYSRVKSRKIFLMALIVLKILFFVF